MQQQSSPLPFDLCDEEGLFFDESPELFVHLDAAPIVFTVRGLAYFAPRFKYAGLDLAIIRTRADFDATYSVWCRTEWSLLLEKIQGAAGATNAANAHQVLQAILSGDVEAAERAVARLEHRERAGLRAIAGGSPRRH
jgi:hypothetical protein